MLLQILNHTPIYVWAILATLIVLGVKSMREREMTLRRLLILPLAMLALSLNDIGNKFGFTAPALAAWSAGCVCAALFIARFGRRRISASTLPGHVRVAGSAAPLATMMAVFFTKYAASVMLALRPQLGAAALAVLPVGALFGIFNGVLLGRLLRDLPDLRAASGYSRVEPVAALRNQSLPPLSSADAITSSGKL